MMPFIYFLKTKVAQQVYRGEAEHSALDVLALSGRTLRVHTQFSKGGCTDVEGHMFLTVVTA